MALTLSLDKICIICLQDKSNMISINERDKLTQLKIAEKIAKCCPEFGKEEFSDKSDNICKECIDDLASAYRFQNNVETSILFFRCSEQEDTTAHIKLSQHQNKLKENHCEANTPPWDAKPEEKLETDEIKSNDSESHSPDKDEVHLKDEDYQETVETEYDEYCEMELQYDYGEEHLSEHSELESGGDLQAPAAEVDHNIEIRQSMRRRMKKSPTVIANETVALRTKMRNPMKKIKALDTRPPKICEICGNSYKYQHALNAHMRRHTNDRPYTCECCEKAFVSGVELRRHMRVHTGDKPYPCNYCDRRFSDYGSRIKHERTHTGERPFVCRTCNKSFAYAHVLSVHLRTHTGEKKFQCSHCGKGFTKKAYMLAHMEQHTRSTMLNMKLDSNDAYLRTVETSAKNNNLRELAGDEESLEEFTTFIIEEVDGENVLTGIVEEQPQASAEHILGTG